MNVYLTQFFNTIAEALNIAPQMAANFFYIAVLVLIVVLLLIAIFKKMKIFLWVSIGVVIMMFAFGGSGAGFGNWVSSIIDSQYCEAQPNTFWCK